jgi:hypothetical protein
MNSYHVLFRGVGEVLRRVRNKQVVQVVVLLLGALPVLDSVDIDAPVLVAEWVAEEAQVARTELAVDLVAPERQITPLAILQHVVPNLGVTMVRVQHRSIIQLALEESRLAIPELHTS